MKVIYKYPVTIGAFSLSLPKGAEILSVQNQNNQPQIWVMIETDNPEVLRNFTVYGTGHQINDTNLKYIGTFQMSEGVFIWHLFEILSYHQLLAEGLKNL